MQACRVLRNPTAAAQTSTRVNLARHRTSLPVHSDRVAAGEPQLHRRDLHEPQAASTLLQNTVSLLPRALSTADNIVGPSSSFFWSSLLERSVSELCSSPDPPSKATIAICGFDKWARSHDLVTALLEDPFTSDSTYSDVLRNRWKNAPSCINIEYGKPSAFAGELSSPSGWLQRFPHAIRLTEFPDLSSLSSVSDETDSLLLSSDVLLLLCDPVVTPLSDLAVRARHLLDKPNTVLVLTSGSMSDEHRSFVSRTLSDMGCRPGHVLFVDPRQALGAVTALQADPTSPSTIDRYQRDTLGSRIATVAVAIEKVLGGQDAPKTSLSDLRRGTALTQVHGSLSASFRSVGVANKVFDGVDSRIDELSSRVQRIGENARRDVFGKPGGDDKIEKALSLSAKEMDALLRSLSFWRLAWRADEIGSLVSAAVQGQWCKGLEHQLILQTGRLESTQRELTDSSFSLVSAAPLRSPVLENHLEQLKHSPARALTPSSLTQPIHDRRGQLIQHTTTRLHREAQSAVIGAFGGVLSGAGLAWWLAFGEHILSLGPGTEMGTAIGSGALLAMGSVRWAVGKWERAKLRWMQDSVRVGEGLARDLQSTVQRTLDDNVVIEASAACKGIQDLVDRRRNEIRQVHGELCDLEAELYACAQFPASWTGPSPSIKAVDSE